MSVSSNLLILLAAPSKQQSVPVTLCPFRWSPGPSHLGLKLGGNASDLFQSASVRGLLCKEPWVLSKNLINIIVNDL